MSRTLSETRRKPFMRRLCAVCAMLLLVPLLASCSDTAGKKTLCQTLFSPYTVEIEFAFDKDGASVCGRARLTRGKTVRIDILSPDPFTGISAEMSADDRAELISLSYSGIKVALPKNTLDKLDLMLSLFADRAASCVEKMPAKAFEPCEDVYTVEGLAEVKPYKVSYTYADVQVLLVYDCKTGTPLDICAKTDGSAAEVKITKFKGTT